MLTPSILVRGSGSQSWQGRVRVQRDVLPRRESAVDDAPRAADFTCHRDLTCPDLAISARIVPANTSPAVEEKTGRSALNSRKLHYKYKAQTQQPARSTRLASQPVLYKVNKLFTQKKRSNESDYFKYSETLSTASGGVPHWYHWLGIRHVHGHVRLRSG